MVVGETGDRALALWPRLLSHDVPAVVSRAAPGLAFGLLAFALLAAGMCPSAVQAACVKEERPLKISAEAVARLQGVVCSDDAQGGAPMLRAEKYQLSEAAAAALMTPASASSFLGPLRGARLQENRLSEIYRDLLTRFGTNVRLAEGMSASLEFKDVDATQDIAGSTGKTIRTLYGESYDVYYDYPAIDEIESLSRKVIPNRTNFYYRVTCEDEEPKPGQCTKFDLGAAKNVFWRSLTSSDVREYSNRVRRINVALRKANKTHGLFTSLDPPRAIRMLDYIAAGNWPERLVVMSATHVGDDEAGCSSGGWIFSYVLPSIELEVLVIENLSGRPLRIDTLLGSISRENALRLSEGASSKDDLQVPAAALLPPSGKLVVPVRLLISAADVRDDESLSKAAFDRLGLNRFAGDASSYRVPDDPEFLFGPALDVNALVVNGRKLSLAEQVANVMTLTVSSGVGSCPYLLHQTASGDWVDNGKILERARGEGNEMTKSIAFPGLVTTFRIEEREPEVAHIRNARLLLRTRSGAVVELASERFAKLDGPASLWWGEGMELKFAVPPAVDPRSVVESVLTVSGYYERYSDLKGRFYSARYLVDQMERGAQP